MKRTLLALIAVSLSCCSKASPQEASYVVTEDDEYAIYRAIIDLEVSSYPGISVSVDAALSHEQAKEVVRLETPEGFEPVALAGFKRKSELPSSRRLDSARLSRSETGDTMHAKYTFAEIGFDARGIIAVTYASKLMHGEGRGNVYALVRTVDGKWAVTRSRMVWIS